MTCPFCHTEAHLGACLELIVFTESVKEGIRQRVLNLHSCPSCGDPTAGDCCVACQEWESTVTLQSIQTKAAVALALEVA